MDGTAVNGCVWSSVFRDSLFGKSYTILFSFCDGPGSLLSPL
jgi:hypothetical protein